MPPIHPWPALEVIRRALAGDVQGINGGGEYASGWSAALGDELDAQAEYLLLPLTELARRRADVQKRQFSTVLAAGRLVAITLSGHRYGVLLDHQLGAQAWSGWLAASEPDWAGPFDVLLEPIDEPFEPMFAVVQTWNRLQLTELQSLPMQVVGEISAARLTAMRAVAQEADAATPPALPPEPGRIALRTVAGSHLVLTGTPLAAGDERLEYQRLYAAAAQNLCAGHVLSSRLVAAVGAPSAAAAPERVRVSAAAQAEALGWGQHVLGWLVADWLVRPALVVLLLTLLWQQWPRRGPSEGLDGGGLGLDAERIEVRWQPDAGIAAIAALLQAGQAQVVAGPNAQGYFTLAVANRASLAELLQQSALVAHWQQP